MPQSYSTLTCSIIPRTSCPKKSEANTRARSHTHTYTQEQAITSTPEIEMLYIPEELLRSESSRDFFPADMVTKQSELHLPNTT
jgi:hypothetical protein